MLAYYLVTRIPAIEHIFINQPMTVQGERRFKPNLVICRGSQIHAFLDVKIDLGYKRSQFDATMCDTDKRIGKLRGQECEILAKQDGTRVRRTLTVASNARCLFAVITDKNVSRDIFSGFEQCAKRLRNTTLHVLTRDCHLNHFSLSKEEILDQITICHDAFEEMEEVIRKSLSGE